MSACNPYSCDRHFYSDQLISEDIETVQKALDKSEHRLFFDLDQIEAMFMIFDGAKPKGWKILFKSGNSTEFALGPGLAVWKALQGYKGEIE